MELSQAHFGAGDEADAEFGQAWDEVDEFIRSLFDELTGSRKPPCRDENSIKRV
jgi:hypothetical protein